MLGWEFMLDRMEMCFETPLIPNRSMVNNKESNTDFEYSDEYWVVLVGC
jgi:hypothetical protein